MQGRAHTRQAGTVTAMVGLDAISAQTRLWLLVFPVTAAALFALRPSATAALLLAVVVSVLMSAMANMACASGSVDAGKSSVARLSPVLSALFIVVAANFGHSLADSSLSASCAIAAVALVGLYVTDALVSGAALLAASRGSLAAGAPVALLIDAKYSGLFGRLG